MLAAGGGALALAVVGVGGSDDSEGDPLGTVMNLEPSLLVYFAVFRGDAGVWEAGFWLLAGIVGLREQGSRGHEDAVRDTCLSNSSGDGGGDVCCAR